MHFLCNRSPSWHTIGARQSFLQAARSGCGQDGLISRPAANRRVDIRPQALAVTKALSLLRLCIPGVQELFRMHLPVSNAANGLRRVNNAARQQRSRRALPSYEADSQSQPVQPSSQSAEAWLSMPAVRAIGASYAWQLLASDSNLRSQISLVWRSAIPIPCRKAPSRNSVGSSLLLPQLQIYDPGCLADGALSAIR